MALKPDYIINVLSHLDDARDIIRESFQNETSWEKLDGWARGEIAKRAESSIHIAQTQIHSYHAASDYVLRISRKALLSANELLQLPEVRQAIIAKSQKTVALDEANKKVTKAIQAIAARLGITYE